MADAFTALYSAALRDFLGVVDDKTLRTFLGLAAHADARGVCFPGVRELSNICAMPIASVLEGLFTLNEMGMIAYLRRDQHDPITRRQLPNVYALNPGLLRISEPLEGVPFVTDAIITKKPDRYYPSTPIHKQNQEEQESSSNKKQLQQPAPQRSKTTPVGSFNTDQPSASLHETPSNPTTPSKKQDTPPGETTSPEGDESHKSARREPRSVQRYKATLDHADAELLATRLMNAGAPNLSIENARMFVDVYGLGIVRHALAEFSCQTNLKNPGGWLRKMIRFLDAQEGNDEPT